MKVKEAKYLKALKFKNKKAEKDIRMETKMKRNENKEQNLPCYA